MSIKRFDLIVTQRGNHMAERADGDYVLFDDAILAKPTKSSTTMTSKPKTGRPAPLGRKLQCGIRLTPDVVEFCKQHPEGFVFLETLCRKSKAFKEWQKLQK